MEPKHPIDELIEATTANLDLTKKLLTEVTVIRRHVVSIDWSIGVFGVLLLLATCSR